MVDNITSRAALVSWPPPFSILALTQYIISWVRVDTGAENSTTVDADTTQLPLTGLRPNRMYNVTVVAVNRVEGSPPSDPEVFTTAEDGKSRVLSDYLTFCSQSNGCIQIILLSVQYQRKRRPSS